MNIIAAENVFSLLKAATLSVLIVIFIDFVTRAGVKGPANEIRVIFGYHDYVKTNCLIAREYFCLIIYNILEMDLYRDILILVLCVTIRMFTQCFTFSIRVYDGKPKNDGDEGIQFHG